MAGIIRQRSSAIDTLRVIGIVAIVAGHVWWDNPWVRDALYSWHVPIFFFLSGYLWKSGRTVRTEMSNRTRTLLIPYVTWLVIIAAAYIPWLIQQGRFEPRAVLDLVLGGDRLGRPFSAFWFMSALFVAAIVYRVFSENLPKWVVWALAVAGLAAAWAAPHLLASVPFSAGVAVPALIFIAAGHLLREHRGRFTRPALTGIILVVISAILVFIGVARPLDMKQADMGTPVISVLVATAICCGLVLVAEVAMPKAPRGLGATMVLLASAGTMVILTHAIVLWILATPPEGSLLAFAAALIVPWAVALLAIRSPLAPCLNGSPKPPRRSHLID